MASSRLNEKSMLSNLIGELRLAICPVPPRPSSSHSGRQAMAWPSDTARHESPSPVADPEQISITTLLPHAPDLPHGISPALEDRLLRAVFNTQFEAVYGPIGTEVIQPGTYDVLSNQSAIGYCTQRAISFDDEDDEEYFPDSLASQQLSTPALIHTTSPAFQPIDMGLVDYPTAPPLDLNPPASKPLDPAAPAFEYLPSNRHIQDMATEADQEVAQAPEPIPELPAPEFPAEAASAPTPQPQITPQGTIRLRTWYHHPNNEKKREKAAQLERSALEAQSRGRSNGGGVANGNGAARSQKPQNGSSASKLSSGPYGQSRSNGSQATTSPPWGPSGSNSSTKPSPSNGSSRPRRPYRNSPSSSRSGPSTPPRTGSNSPATPATTDTSLSTSPTPSVRPPHKLKDTAGPSNSVERPANPKPSKGPRSPTRTTGTVRTYGGGATPQRPPTAPTTGTTGVPAATTSNRRGGSVANSWRQSPQTGTVENSRSAGQSSKASPRSPTSVLTQTSASNGIADAGPSIGRRSTPVEPVRTGDQESAVLTRPPTSRPTQMSTGQGVVDAGPSAEGSSAQVMGSGRNSGHGIYETRMGKFEAMRGRWRRGG